MADGSRTYSFDQLHDRIWQIAPSAWVIAKSSTPGMRAADLDDVQVMPAEPDGMMIIVKIKTASRVGILIRGKVLANGEFEISQPEAIQSLGSIFDEQAPHRLASVIANSIGKS